jgi:hypothetical protein
MKFYLFLFLCCFAILQGCKDKHYCKKNQGHQYYQFTNTSTKRVYHIIFWNYPDNTLPDYDVINSYYYSKKVVPGATIDIEGGKDVHYPGENCWEYFFDRKKEAEYVYIFDADTLETLGWEKVRATDRGLLEVKKLTINLLEQNNWNIKY